MIEDEIRKAAKESAAEIKKTFNSQEQLQISFIPLVYGAMAFYYADLCKEYSAENRISILKGLSRAYTKLKKSYAQELAKDLNAKAMESVEECAGMFMNNYQTHFIRAYFAIKNEFDKLYPHYPYGVMRSNALFGMVIIQMLKEHIKYVNELINSKNCNTYATVINPKIDALYDILLGYAGAENFNFSDPNVSLAAEIIRNKIKEIEFNIV